MLRYASIFLNQYAKETIKALQSEQFKSLDISKLMPAFMNIRRERQTDMLLALDYIMNYCIQKKGSRSKTVHNMAFFFNSKVSDPKRLL